MYKYAQILNSKVHWIFEDKMKLQELYAEKYSKEIVLIDITQNTLPIVEGWGYMNDVFIDPNPPPTPEQIQKSLTDAVQAHMDSKARERNYDNIASACSYTVSIKAKFKAEGEACAAWRDEVWVKCYEILDEVTSKQREIPTSEELIAELPVLVWPAD